MSDPDQRVSADSRLQRPATRVDAAHTIRQLPAAESPEPRVQSPDPDHFAAAGQAPIAVAAHPAEALTRQVQTQAAQLAAHLQDQQTDLDHRQAAVNARTAAAENQLRGAQIWLQERQQEVADQRARLVQLQELVEQRLGDLGIVSRNGTAAEIDTELTRRARAVQEGETQLARRDEELARREKQLAPESDRLEDRRRYLDNLETMLENEQQQLAAGHHKFKSARAAWDEERQRQAEQMAARLAHAEDDLAQRERIVTQQRVELEDREKTVQAMRDEMARTEREVVENRLATEQMWAQAVGRLGQREGQDRLDQIRARLADHYHLAKAELAGEKEQLLRLAAKIVGDYESLEKRAEAIRQWAGRQARELSDRAERLEDRQRELAHRDTQHDEFQIRWQEERSGYQREIRKLRARLQAEAAPE